MVMPPNVPAGAASGEPSPGDQLYVVGRSNCLATHELRVFLARNDFRFHWIDVDHNPVAQFLLAGRAFPDQTLPVVLFPDGARLTAPSRLAVVKQLGVPTAPSRPEYDVAILGAGPAGLTAAVYAASEGLRTIITESEAPGGQAGTSSRIENYPGFPEGISGPELMRRTLQQALRLGAELLLVNGVDRGEPGHRAPFLMYLADGTELRSHTIIVATGVAYRLLDAPGIAAFAGAGVYYGSVMSEAPQYRDCDVYVVGGANSAGQTALHLARFARSVTLLVRGSSLESSMSQYLIEQLAAIPNVVVKLRTQIVEALGDGRLEALRLRADSAGSEATVAADAAFILIGQKPATEWAEGLLLRDPHGFLLTGLDLFKAHERAAVWPLVRDPLPFETSWPGIFSAGDVRHGSIKRVASAVGEGALAVRLVHQYVRELNSSEGGGLPQRQAPAVSGQPAESVADERSMR